MPRWRGQRQQQQWGGEEAQPELTFINGHRQPGSLLPPPVPSTVTRPRKMVAVQTSPNASPSAEWICCLDKRWVDGKTLRAAFVISTTPFVSFSTASAWFNRGRRSLRVRRRAITAGRRHAFVIAHKQVFFAYLSIRGLISYFICAL